MSGVLDGKVALVTGAGGGLGEAYAMALAAAGARVVVNDLGGARDGTGGGASMADRVVEAIRAAGGEAVADYGSVSDEAQADGMIARAVEAFGRLDVVVNNAGILRDKTLVRMSKAQWDAVIDVHLTGTFLVTRAAFKQLLRAGQGGRIINTSSVSGLKGSFGQGNYGAAKAGIAGLTRVVALEGRKAGITANAIAPVAKTRMTEDIDAVPDAMRPEDIAPLVVWLASDASAEVTGRVFGAHGRHYFEYTVETTPGVEPEQAWTHEGITAAFERITATVSAPAPATSAASGGDDAVRAIFEALPRVYEGKGWDASIVFEVKGAGRYGVRTRDDRATFDPAPQGKGDGVVTFDSAATLLALASGKLNPQQAFMSQKIATSSLDVLMRFAKCFDLARAARLARGEEEVEAAPEAAPERAMRDLIGKKYLGRAGFVTAQAARLYIDATEQHDPPYFGEGGESATMVPPMFAVRPFMEGLIAFFEDEEAGVDLTRVLHGEQDMRFHAPVHVGDLVVQRTEIFAVEDKSSGRVVRLKQRLLRDGEIVCEAISSMFIRATTRSVGDKPASAKASAAPSQEQEHPPVVFSAQQEVAADQSLRYAEASGDHNPIHVDPEFARAAGLPGIILHGLCTMAFASRAVVQGACGGDPVRLQRLKVRFIKPVRPGDVLTTEGWRAGAADDAAGVEVYGLELLNQDGEVVLGQAVAEVAQAVG